MSEIDLSVADRIATITLNRPLKRNALRAEDWRALETAARAIPESGARAAVLRGEGGNFCSGFDIAEIEPATTNASELIADFVNPALRALRDLEIPVVAAVEGACVGGGFGIAATCDIVIASDTARFGAPYARIGIMADAGLHLHLRETLGYQRAAYLIFTGRTLTADEALGMGLCCEVLPRDSFAGEARAFVRRLADGPTRAFAMSKRILRTQSEPVTAMEVEAQLQGQVFATQDATAGIAAFLAGRAAEFSGR